MDLVSWTFDNLKYNHTKPLYIDAQDSTRSLSALNTKTIVRELASGFSAYGLRKGDCVCVASFNDIYYTSLFLGIIGAGGTFSGANPGYTAYELIHHLRITEAKFVLASPNTLEVALLAAKTCGIPESRVFLLDFETEVTPSTHQSWRRLLDHGETDWVRPPHPDETPAALVSTSGTSGLPKAAIIPHSFFVSQGRYQEEISKTRYRISNLIAIPPFHAFTIPVQHTLTLRKGIPAYILPRFQSQSFLLAIEKFKITHTLVVPPILSALSKLADCRKLASLRRFHVAGSPTADSLQQQFYAKLPRTTRIEQVYGLTETGWSTCWHDRERENTGSVGRPITGTELRLIGRYGDVVLEDSIPGEIQIKASHPMRGYLNNPSATEEAFSVDGWIRTGDVGYHREGKWYIVDRTKDLIKVRGWQVSPVEIELSLAEHPDILDAAVIGIPASDGSGEVPLAFVVRKEDSSLREDEIKSFLGERLARYKMIDSARFVDIIPRNPTGKILRRVLRDRDEKATQPGDQGAALAYSTALQDLALQQHRRRSTRTCSTASLTDASTIHTDGPATPPSMGEMAEVHQPLPSSRKRKADLRDSRVVKRRSSRIMLLRGADVVAL